MRRALRHALALDGQVHRLEEKASYGPRLSGLAEVSAELSTTLATRWEVRRALVQLLAEDDRLMLVMRPNLSDVGDWASWRVGDLLNVIGSGVMRTGLSQARELDEKSPEAAPFFDALEAEVSLRAGDEADAVRLATSAIAALSREEALVRWRAHAVRAEALRQAGADADARADWDVVMRQWPTVLRVLDLGLPVSLSHDGSSLADETASRLGRSRRFRLTDGAPFKLRVDAQGKGVVICLTDVAGSRLTCSTGETAQAALDTFHGDAFSPKVSLTDTDLRSLDGSPVRVSADEALKKVLEP